MMKRQYLLFVIIVSLSASLLIHLPELISLFMFSEGQNIFNNINVLDVFSEIIFTSISFIIFFFINFYIFPFHHPGAKISIGKVILAFLLSWDLSSVIGKTFVFLHNSIGLPAITANMHQYLHPIRDIVIAYTVVGSCYIIYILRRQEEILFQNKQLQSENIKNSYLSLKNQLNPHMLFNSLNTLYSLVREDSDKAQKYIHEMSLVLRYTLRETDSNTVTVKEEMDFVSSYIFMLKMRFEKNLIFNINIKDDNLSRHLPVMAVQILIENAVKHNEISSKNLLEISIVSCGDSIIVSNHIQPKITQQISTGVGLDNLSKRYKLLCNKEIDIMKDGNIFSVSLPLI